MLSFEIAFHGLRFFAKKKAKKSTKQLQSNVIVALASVCMFIAITSQRLKRLPRPEEATVVNCLRLTAVKTALSCFVAGIEFLENAQKEPDLTTS